MSEDHGHGPPAYARGYAARRLLFWGLLAIWAVVSYVIGERLAEDMRFRVNDFSVIPGAGLVMRDAAGVFYHVNTEGRARAIFPDLAPPVYQQECLDCTLVTGEQLSQTNDFCASGRRSELPELRFEIPCQTWAPIGEGHKVMAFVVFVLPLVLLAGLRMLARQLAAKARPKPAK